MFVEALNFYLKVSFPPVPSSPTSAMPKPYKDVIKENQGALKTFFDDNVQRINFSYPSTVTKDTAYHIPVHSKSKEPLKHLLQYVDDLIVANVFMTNDHKKTNMVLHKVAITYNIAKVKLLGEVPYVSAEHESCSNRSGQTPLFKAALFGSMKVVRYLAFGPNKVSSDNKLQEVHWTRKDETSILHAAV